MRRYIRSFQMANKYTKSFVLATIAMTVMVILSLLLAYMHVELHRTGQVQTAQSLAFFY